ncbi:MAG: ABC transporter permease [Clostridium septicum]|uniref:ABC transporter permease n=1 Tax=Clostridium septicum TaxID=1504 RepID=UPI00082F704B|nr:ABC transporter permease [Clostridium septicum]MDU1314236.1 ABC transporter permease [Clostridium septicum]
MRALYYIKTTLKGMISNGLVTISYFVLFPVLLAFFMAFFQGIVHENPLKLKQLKVQVIDEDKTEMSKNLTNLLENDEMKKVVSIVDEKPEVELKIEKGYEDKILSLSKGNIIINKKVEESNISTNTLKVILDKYHQNLYVSIGGGNIENLEKISDETIVENTTIDIVKTATPYEKLSASMIGFVITMLIFSVIQSGYADISINLEKRVNSTPITKLQYLFYDTMALLIFVFIIISGYIMFFRLAGLSFKGNLLDLLLLILTGTILVVSISTTISTIFGAKYGKIMGGVIFTLPLISGEIFMGEGNKIALLTPTHYLNNAFSLYNLNGNLEGCGKWILMIFIISSIVYSMSIIKAGFNRGKKICA